MPPLPSLIRLTLKNGRAAAEVRIVGAKALEFPQINYGMSNGRPYHYIYGIGASGQKREGFYNVVVKVTLSSGARTEWAEEGIYPGEPVFVPKPDSTREDDGLLLTLVLDAKRGKSTLVLLDAGSLEPVARAFLPHRIPYGFHGAYWPAGTIQ